MRRLTLPCLLLIGAALAPSAKAQIPVTDSASIVARALEATRQLQQAVQSYNMLQNQYRQMVNTYESITGARDFGGLVNALGAGGLSRSYLPGAGNISSLMHGGGGLWGQAQAMLNRNRLYASPERDDWTIEMERREQVTANAQALAGAGLEDAEERIQRLQDMRAQIEGQDDLRAATGLNGIIAAEQQNLSLHRTQVEQIRLLLATEDRVERQRADQLVRRDLDEWLARSGAAGAAW